MKTIIAGSRTITDYNLVLKEIKESGFNITEVVSGMAKGVDTLAVKYAKENNISLKKFYADWKDLSHPNSDIRQNAYGKYDKNAGLRRNRKMAKYADVLIAISKNNSTGTRHMIRTMESLNKPYFVLNISKNNEIVNWYGETNEKL